MTPRRHPPIALIALAAATLAAVASGAALPAARRARSETTPVVTRDRYTTGEGGIRGLGELLSFPSPGRFRLVVSSCVRPDSASSGRALMRDGSIVLRAGESDEDVLTPVRWGPRQYLVGDLLAFVNDVNAGIEPREDDWGKALLRVGDWNKAVDSLPPLPSPWDKRLLARAIEGRVSEVLPERKDAKDKRVYGRAAVGLGADQQAFVGMVLWADNGPKAHPFPATVVSVEKSRCVVEATWGRFALDQKITSVKSKP